jgi:sugar lactone lactonase YvrE
VGVTAFGVYDGNLYLLDTGKNWVWKYFASDTGFGEKQDYFLFDTLVDLSGADGIVVDTAVWINKQGKILRFSQGRDDVWQIQALPTPLGVNTAIFTDQLTSNLYILDRQNRRVVAVSKDGKYVSEYHWQENVPISDFVVSEVLKKILLLSNGTIYAVELK